jgi:ABC-2 type transport system permease protein
MFLAIGTYLVDVGQVFADLAAQNPTLADVLGKDDATGAFVRIMMLFGGLCALGFGISGVGRARSEETDGRAEVLLAAPISRPRWLTAALGVPGLGAVALLLIAAVGMYLGALSAGFDGPGIGGYLLTAVAYVPPTALVLGLAAALFAWAPRLMGIAWVFVVWGLIDGMFGNVLGAPSWLRDLNVFRAWDQYPAGSGNYAGWVPNPLGSASTNWLPLLWLALLAAALYLLAFAGVRRRDIPAV